MTVKRYQLSVVPKPSGDWIATYLSAYNNGQGLLPGQWTGAVDFGVDAGLNAYHDPTARSDSRIASATIAGNTLTVASHTWSNAVGKQIFFADNGELVRQLRTIVATTPTTITFDGTPSTTSYSSEILLFPDFYTRSLPFEDERGGMMFEYDAHFYYDPTTGLHQIGGGVGSLANKYKGWYLRYDPRSNRWFKRWNHPNGSTGHHYCLSAMDTVGRKYYRVNVSGSSALQFDMDNEALPPVSTGTSPVTSSNPASAVFHEGLGRLYVIGTTGNYAYWTAQNGWSSSFSTITLEQHSLAAYHKNLQVAVFGGGNAPSKSFWKIPSNGGPAVRLDDAPIGIEPAFGTQINCGGVATPILDAGLPDAFIVFPNWPVKTSLVSPYDQIWLLKPNAPSGQQWVRSVDTPSASFRTWSGYRQTAWTALPHLGVIMSMRYNYSSVSSINAPSLTDRPCQVFFYRPSGN